eukprot:11163337-Lingulodinium_polyedra.AAC.1
MSIRIGGFSPDLVGSIPFGCFNPRDCLFQSRLVVSIRVCFFQSRSTAFNPVVALGRSTWYDVS